MSLIFILVLLSTILFVSKFVDGVKGFDRCGGRYSTPY